MQALLGSEAGSFLDSLETPPGVGLRVNTLKTTPEAFDAVSPCELEPVPWCPEGFVVSEAGDVRPGRHAYHAAGLCYLQDPSAMAAMLLLDPQPGEAVLDLCAAPGGKATHIAACLQNEGLLVANEVVRSRAAALVENLERCGVTRALVVSGRPATLAERWPEAFDRVLVDAPCSGEGMFRKWPHARQEWRPAIVAGCAARQAAILEAAAHMVRPGGRLVYATCTFAPEENEAVVARFLRAHPDFALVPPPAAPGLDPGRPDWIAPDLARGLPLERCVRLWPHRAPGEGHFFAILEREGESPPARWPQATDRLPARAARLLRPFWETTLTRPLPERGWGLVSKALHLQPTAPAVWRPLRPVRAGWRIGRLAPNRLVPDHALALALRPHDARHTLDLAAGSPEVTAYLRGETLRAPGPEGWLLVTVDGFPLGWGKRVGDVVKNHYPRSLRWRF
jgi:NOL1/NOP2/sun family putative RNA methylase